MCVHPLKFTHESASTKTKHTRDVTITTASSANQNKKTTTDYTNQHQPTHLVAAVRREEHRVALRGLRRGEVGDREVTAADSRVAVDALQDGLDRRQAGALGGHG